MLPEKGAPGNENRLQNQIMGKQPQNSRVQRIEKVPAASGNQKAQATAGRNGQTEYESQKEPVADGAREEP